MAQLLGHDVRQNALQRQVAAIVEFLQLIASYAIDQKTKDRVVLPGRYEAAKRVHETLLIGLTQHKRDIYADVAGHARYLAEMIDFFRRRTSHNKLIEL